MAGHDEAGGALVIKAINAAAEPVNATINLGGVTHVAFGASLTVLKSNQPGDNNSLENPKMITPVTSVMPVSGNTLTHEFAPYSLLIMRLAAKGTEPVKSADSK